MLKKSAIPEPSPSKSEVVTVPELDGEVLVRGMLLKDRLELALIGGYASLSATLALCVSVDGDGSAVPLFTADEWERWGSKHYNAALKLWDIVRRLSDLDGEQAEKNSPAQNSDSPAVSQ